MKKKKTVHLRRIRKRSTNKFYKADVSYFERVYELFFNKIFKKKSSSFISFLFCFIAINKKKIFDMLKIFGMNSVYRLKVNKIKDISIFAIFFRKKYSFLYLNSVTRRKNVDNKKKLFIHISYRHILSLPVRGQRTKTNGKTRKHYGII